MQWYSFWSICWEICIFGLFYGRGLRGPERFWALEKWCGIGTCKYINYLHAPTYTRIYKILGSILRLLQPC